MAITPARLTAICLLDCGIEDASASPAPFLAIAKARILDDINSTLQKIYSRSPQWLSEYPFSAILPAPGTLTGMTLTNGSKTFGGVTPSASQVGSTILIDNQELQNIIASTTTLVHPFAGTTGTYNATIYGDFVHVVGAGAVIPPVGILGGNDLLPMASRATMGQPTKFYNSDHGLGRAVPFGMFTQAGYGRTENRDSGTPVRYRLEHERNLTTGALTFGIRLDPLPEKSYTLHYTVKLDPPSVSDPDSTVPVLMPTDTAESVLIPLVRNAFKSFKHNSADKSLVAEDAKEAWAALGSATDNSGGVAASLRIGDHW